MSELLNEFGCVPPPPTTTTTRSPATSTTTSTSTSTTTLPPLTFNPSVGFYNQARVLKSGSNTTYQLALVLNSDHRLEIAGGPPGASFTATIVNPGAIVTYVIDTLSNTGYFLGPTTTLGAVGLWTITVVFSGFSNTMSVLYGTTRVLETAISIPATTATPTTIAPTTQLVVSPNYALSILDTNNLPITTTGEGQTIRIKLVGTNVPDGTVVPYILSGVNVNDFVSRQFLFGNFIIGQAGAGFDTFDLVVRNDYTTEGVETLLVTLQSPGSGSVSITIADTSPLITGTALLTTAGSLSDLSGAAILPENEILVMFKLIGGGGGGGSYDEYGPGAAGGHGGIVEGMVKLPATPGQQKLLRGGVGTGGGWLGAIGKGFAFTTNDYTGNGGAGAPDTRPGRRSWSGQGGAGGGATSLFYSVGNTNIPIGTAGGGGGGGGGSWYVAAAAARAALDAPLPVLAVGNLNGTPGRSPGGDGGGGGGGGGNLGLGGAGGYDRSVATESGTRGRASKNNSYVISDSNWVRFNYVQPTSISTGFFGSGGTADNPGQGGPGLIQVYWTTDITVAWNESLLPVVNGPDITVSVVTSVSGDCVYPVLTLKSDGTGWSNIKTSAIGGLYQVYYELVSGDTQSVIANLSPLNQWLALTQDRPVGAYTSPITIAVSIRRIVDNVVLLNKHNVGFSYGCVDIGLPGGQGSQD